MALIDSYFSHDEFASVNIVLNPETILKPMLNTLYKYGISKIWNKWHRSNIVDNDGMLSLNEKDLEEGLDHKLCEKLQWNIIYIIKNIDIN